MAWLYAKLQPEVKYVQFTKDAAEGLPGATCWHWSRVTHSKELLLKYVN